MAEQANDTLAFHPVVHDERQDGGGEVWIELPEFSIHGVGDTPQEAWADLVEEVRSHVVEYLGDPLFEASSNRGPHKPHVLAAQAADQAGRLLATLMGEVGSPHAEDPVGC
jgi:hypothetical protein